MNETLTFCSGLLYYFSYGSISLHFEYPFEMSVKRNNPFMEDQQKIAKRLATDLFTSLKSRKINLIKEEIPGKEIFSLTETGVQSSGDILSIIFRDTRYPNLKNAIRRCMVKKIGKEFAIRDLTIEPECQGSHCIVEVGPENKSGLEYVVDIQVLQQYHYLGGKFEDSKKPNEVEHNILRDKEISFKKASYTAQFFSKIGYSNSAKGAIGIPMYEEMPYWICRIFEINNDTGDTYGVSLGFTVARKAIAFTNVLKALSANPGISIAQRDAFLFEAYKELYLKINALHKFGYIHGDIKIDNVAFCFMSGEEDSGRLFPFLIDWELLNFGSEVEQGFPTPVAYAIGHMLNDIAFEARNLRYGADDYQMFIAQIKERWTRADLIIFQMIANLITDEEIYNDLETKFNIAFSEINSITIENFSTNYKNFALYTKPALPKEEILLLLKPI